MSGLIQSAKPNFRQDYGCSSRVRVVRALAGQGYRPARCNGKFNALLRLQQMHFGSETAAPAPTNKARDGIARESEGNSFQEDGIIKIMMRSRYVNSPGLWHPPWRLRFFREFCTPLPSSLSIRTSAPPLARDSSFRLTFHPYPPPVTSSELQGGILKTAVYFGGICAFVRKGGGDPAL